MTWVAIFFMIGLFLALSDLDFGFIRENLWYIAKGLQYTILLAVFAIVLAIDPRAVRGARPALAQPGRLRRVRASTRRSSAARR